MTVSLEGLSPKELQALIANAESQMQAARTNQIRDMKQKIEALLDKSGLALDEVYPSRRSKSTKTGQKSAVAPKYRHPQNSA